MPNRKNIKVYDLNGSAVKEINLPEVFMTPYRPDLIKRAVLAMQSARRQAYAPNILAGKRTSAHYHGMRHLDTSQRMMGREMARLPRVHSEASPGMMFRARFVPQAVGGREAHPPKVEKIWRQKINKKENMLAIKSAIAASADKDVVAKRGHIFDIELLELPLVVTDDLEKILKTKDLLRLFKQLKLDKELSRAAEKKIRAGKGKMRGRKYKKKKSLLLVVADDKQIGRAAKNLPGVDVCPVKNLNAELLAPGAHAGRLIIWSESAFAAVDKLLRRQK